MAYGIMRVEKRHKTDVYGIQIEANRSQEKQRDFVRSDIDWDKTGDNIYLIKSDNWDKSINDILAEYDVKARKNSVVLLDGLYTASPEFFTNKSTEDIKKYFMDCLNYHAMYYGEIINAVIHLDEKTPHMQVASVPIVDDWDAETMETKYRLSAKDMMGGRKDYRARQDAFYDTVSKKYGLGRGEISDPDHKREHLSVQDYKIKMQTQTIDEQVAMSKKLEKYHDNLRETIKADWDDLDAANEYQYTQALESARESEVKYKGLVEKYGKLVGNLDAEVQARAEAIADNMTADLARQKKDLAHKLDAEVAERVSQKTAALDQIVDNMREYVDTVQSRLYAEEQEQYADIWGQYEDARERTRSIVREDEWEL